MNGTPTKPEICISPANQSIPRKFFSELLEYRELLAFLVWKDIKVQFAQTVLGFGWLVLRPLLNVVVLTLVFGKIAQLPSNGEPYLLFALSGLVTWNYFSSVTGKAALSLVNNAPLVTKIYFPRTYLPLSLMLSGLVEFSITLLLYLALAGFIYGRWPGAELIYFPVSMALLLLTTFGASIWLAALAIDFRDVRHAVVYLMQMLMFLAPVVWPLSLLPQRLGSLGDGVLQAYAFYPMVGVIESTRFALLGGDAPPWPLVLSGFATAVMLSLTGLWYFHKREQLMADVV